MSGQKRLDRCSVAMLGELLRDSSAATRRFGAGRNIRRAQCCGVPAGRGGPVLPLRFDQR
jgi:hypothetical protein